MFKLPYKNSKIGKNILSVPWRERLYIKIVFFRSEAKIAENAFGEIWHSKQITLL